VAGVRDSIFINSNLNHAGVALSEKKKRLKWIERLLLPILHLCARKAGWVALSLVWISVPTVILSSPAWATCARGSASLLELPNLTFLRSYRASFAGPARLAVDLSGNIFVTNPLKGEVVTRAPDGRVLSRVGGLGYPVSIAVDDGGRIYVGDGEAGRISVFDSTWQKLFDFGQGVGEFVLPSDIALDPSTGRAYVADSKGDRVRVYDALGQFLFDIGEPGSGDGQFAFPAGVFVDRVAGEVLVSDQQNYRIQIFNLDGNFLHCFGRQGSSAGRFSMPLGLWVDAQGLIYVADAFEGRIQVLERNGDSLGFLAAFGTKPGELRIAKDLIIDPSNRLVVASANNERLEMFGLDSYADPELYAPIVIDFEPNPIPRRCDEGTTVAGYIEIAGYRLSQVATNTITANGVPAKADPVSVGDRDNDEIPDLRVEFDGITLLATLPPSGEGAVTVTGAVGTMRFEETVTVLVANTPDGGGCDVVLSCPCDGPAPGVAWKNKGQYMKCVIQAATAMIRDGLISPQDLDDFVNEANLSNCGEKNKKNKKNKK